MSKTQNTNSKSRLGLFAALFAGLILVSGFAGARIQSNNSSGLVTGSLNKQKKVVTRQSQLISQIAKTVGPSVVSVNVEVTSSSSSATDAFGAFGFAGQPQTQQGAGTGIIISSSGLIVTNRHVVPVGTTKVSVTLSDGTELKDVSVVGRTNDSDSLDVAFLKINDAKGQKLTPAVLGNSADTEVGDDVVAIGNALGQFQNTVTSGILSGYGRSVQATDSSGDSRTAENLDNLFQTDAAINEGNSGGPLVNMNAQVIGINTASAGNAQNIGFAIPIDDIRGLVNQVLKNGKFARPYIGIRYVPLSSDIASTYGVKVQKGALIVPSSDQSDPSVLPDSPADKAGLEEKDVIIAVNGTKVNQTHSLTSLLNKHEPGDRVTLTVNRDGKTIEVPITLGTAPSQTN